MLGIFTQQYEPWTDYHDRVLKYHTIARTLQMKILNIKLAFINDNAEFEMIIKPEVIKLTNYGPRVFTIETDLIYHSLDTSGEGRIKKHLSLTIIF